MLRIQQDIIISSILQLISTRCIAREVVRAFNLDGLAEYGILEHALRLAKRKNTLGGVVALLPP
jgi:hypothetical protein